MNLFTILSKLIITLIIDLKCYLGLQDAPVQEILDTSFVVIWNVPSAVCQDKFNVFLNLSKFGILHNKNQLFAGDEMVLFYEPTPGLYPKYMSNGSALNGGLPQNSNIEKHLQRVRTDIERSVPDGHFSGLSVIDCESWTPIFDRNHYDPSRRIYINNSEELVRRDHPSWDDSRVQTEARVEFETAARLLMEKTLQKGREMRANGKWGYYGFPRCYNYKKGQGHCANDTIQYNDRLAWLFNASSSLFPSIYLDRGLFPDVKDRRVRVQGILEESLRVRDVYTTTTPVYAYTMYRYRTEQQFYVTDDIESTVGQSFDAGLSGVVIWDSSKYFHNKSDCLALKQYLDTTLGPFVQNLTTFAGRCMRDWCRGHGRCVKNSWQGAPEVDWETQDFFQYKCICYNHWTGQHCTHHYK